MLRRSATLRVLKVKSSANLRKSGPAQFSKAQFSDNLHSLESARIVAKNEGADMRSQSSLQNGDLADYHKGASTFGNKPIVVQRQEFSSTLFQIGVACRLRVCSHKTCQSIMICFCRFTTLQKTKNVADAASNNAYDSVPGEHDQSNEETGTRFFSLCSALAFVHGVPVSF